MDIRQCSKEDLDRLNAEGKAWRERNNPADNPPAAEAIQSSPEQMNLWEKKKHHDRVLSRYPGPYLPEAFGLCSKHRRQAKEKRAARKKKREANLSFSGVKQ